MMAAPLLLTPLNGADESGPALGGGALGSRGAFARGADFAVGLAVLVEVPGVRLNRGVAAEPVALERGVAGGGAQLGVGFEVRVGARSWRGTAW